MRNVRYHTQKYGILNCIIQYSTIPIILYCCSFKPHNVPCHFNCYFGIGMNSELWTSFISLPLLRKKNKFCTTITHTQIINIIQKAYWRCTTFFNGIIHLNLYPKKKKENFCKKRKLRPLSLCIILWGGQVVQSIKMMILLI